MRVGMRPGGLLSLPQPLKILLGVLTLIARERNVLQRVRFFGQRRTDLLLDGFQRLAGLIRATRVTNPHALARLGIGTHARVVKALVRLFLRAVANTAALVHSLALLAVLGELVGLAIALALGTARTLAIGAVH